METSCAVFSGPHDRIFRDKGMETAVAMMARRRRKQQRGKLRPELSASASPLRKRHGGKDENVVSDRDHTGLFRAEAEHERDVQSQQQAPDAQRTRRRRRGSALTKANGMESWRECPDRASQWQRWQEWRSSQAHIGCMTAADPNRAASGQTFPAAPLVIGHGGIGDHGPVDHSQQIQSIRWGQAPHARTMMR